MKYGIVILILLFPVFANAQKANPLDTLVKDLIADLKSSWTLGVDSNSTTVDINMYNKYKSLFDTSATINDDLNIRFIPGKNKGYYKILPVSKGFDLYAHDVALQVNKIRVLSVTDSMKNIENSSAIILILEKSVYVEKAKKYVFPFLELDTLVGRIKLLHPGITFEKTKGKINENDKNKLTENLAQQISNHADSMYKFNTTSLLRITMAYYNDSLFPVKIKKIETLTNKITCLNDRDADGILDTLDFNPNIYGEFTANGSPDWDLDGTPDFADKCKGTYGSKQNKGCPDAYFTTSKQWQGFIGYQFNALKINLPELNRLGYYSENGTNAMDVLESKKGNIKNPTGARGIFGGGNLAFYFGKSAKHTGISIGLTYARFISNYTLTEPIVYTYKSNDGTNFYRRQLTINSLQEEISFNVVNVPIMFDYRFKPFKNNHWMFNLKVGPSVLFFNNVTDYNSNIDFGGIYQIDTINRDRITYYDFFNRNSTFNVYLTSKGINNQNTNPGAASIFSQLNSNSNSYDFAINKNYRNKQNLTRTTVAYNLSIDGQYKRNKDNPISLKWGAHFMYAPLPERKEKYRPINRTTDSYNSIFNSSAKSSYLVYGLNVGLAYSF